MQVISAPHPTLRKVAQTVNKFDKRFFKFVDRLKTQLVKEKDPEGVGLAAPQVNQSWQVFVARPGKSGQLATDITVFINPQIIDHAPEKTLLDDSQHFEGCLSVPLIYGPVPRWQWVLLRYQTIEDGKIVEKEQRFEDYMARVVQHEYDHLQGILFTDYLLSNNLPAYVADQGQWVIVENRQILETF